MGLEEELNALMAGAHLAVDGAKDAKKEASRIRRRSKDLEDAMNDMTEGTADTASDVAKLASSASSDEDLAKLFKEIDKDDSKTIEVDELQTALKEKLGIDKSKEDLEAAFKEVNEGKDSKSIDEATFKTLVAKFKK